MPSRSSPPEPSGPPRPIERPRLLSRLDEGLRRRLTTVVGGPGSGKSTLFRQWSEGRPVALHTVTSADAELGAFVRAVVDALRLRVPRLAGELSLAVEGVLGPDAADPLARADALASLVSEELSAARLTRHVTLALDDVHRLPVPCARFVGTLAANAPPRFHVFAASREPMSFPVSRLALEGHLLEVPAAELAFTEDELARLLAAVAGPDMPSLAPDLHDRTAGWPAVCRLAAESLRTAPRTDVDDLLPQSEVLFDYLAQEVLGAEPEDVREFIDWSATLPWITAGMAEDLGIGQGRATFDRTRRRAIYLGDDHRWPGAMALAPVMRTFVESYRAIESDEHAGILMAGCGWYEKAGAIREALACAQRAGNDLAVARLLTEHGSTVLAGGRAADVVHLAESLPDELRTPAIRVLEGEARLVTGDWEGALGAFVEVAPARGKMDSGLAWRIGLIHHLRGRLDDALAAYERGAPGSGPASDDAMLLAWTASARWLRGDLLECRRLADQAFEVARRAQDPRALAAAHTVLALVAALDGDRNANDAHYLRALELATRAQDVIQTIRIRVNRGSRGLEEGSFAEAIEELDQALRLADLAGFTSFRALALSNRGEALLHQGRLEEAIADLEEARALMRQTSSTMESYPLSHLGDVYRTRGDAALAEAAYEQAIALAEQSGDLQGLVPSLAGLAMLVAESDLDRAARLAERALSNASTLGHAAALVATGLVALRAGDHRTALERAAEAAELARARRDRPGLARALRLEARATDDEMRAADALDQSRRIWEQVGDPLMVAVVDADLARLGTGDDPSGRARSAAERLRRLGGLGLARDIDDVIAALDRVHPPVTVRTMGGFAVLRGGETVPAGAWQSRKARDLLKLLVVQRGRPQHRETLMEQLWPGDDPEKTSNRLSVALSTVRGVFDPDKEHPSDHFISGDRETVALVLDHVEVDIELFTRRAEEGLDTWNGGDHREARACLEAAEGLYVGDFLEEDLYEDWAIPVREQCRDLYMKVAERLATHYRDIDDHEAATRVLLRMIERDPYHERAHLALVRSMSAVGRHGGARRLYGQYVTRMRELDVEPAAFPSE